MATVSSQCLRRKLGAKLGPEGDIGAVSSQTGAASSETYLSLSKPPRVAANHKYLPTLGR